MKALQFLIYFGAVILVASDCAGGDKDASSSRFGGGENKAIIARLISVKAWRTVGSLNSSPSDYFEKSGTAIIVSTNLAVQLSKALLSEDSFENPGSTPGQCLIEPEVVVAFSDGKHNLDVFFCFECDVLVARSEAKEIANRFTPGRVRFVQIMKKIFPKDPQIQLLKEQG